MEKDRKFRALAIAAICVAVVGVSVAYASLTASLTITGTATVETADAWKVQWSNVGTMSKSTAVEAETAVISSGNQQITWSATFGAPKTYLEFDATFTNSGTIPAKLESGTYVSASGDAASHFTYSVTTADGDNISDKAGYILGSGKSVTLTIRVEFDKEGALTDLSTVDSKTATFTLNLPWVQATDAEVSSGNQF